MSTNYFLVYLSATTKGCSNGDKGEKDSDCWGLRCVGDDLQGLHQTLCTIEGHNTDPLCLYRKARESLYAVVKTAGCHHWCVCLFGYICPCREVHGAMLLILLLPCQR